MISHIKLYGERNTGTNYLEALITANIAVEILPGAAPARFQQPGDENEAEKDQYFLETFPHNLGWKHALAPAAEPLKNINNHERKILFITLTKNPYSWLLSLYRNPYHAHCQIHRTFSEFLSKPWKTVGRELAAADFANPIDLWNQKNASYLQLSDYAECVNLRYEDLLEDTRTCVQRIAHDYTLAQKTRQFLDLIQSTKGEQGKNKTYYRDYYLSEKWRDELDAGHIDQINASLDKNILERFRYSLIEGNDSAR